MSQTLHEPSSELVMHAARIVRLIRRELDQPAGVRVLAALDELGPLGITALAAADNCSQPTMSGTVRDLVSRGWVDKQPHPSDARSSVIELTVEGRRALSAVRRRNGELISSRLGDVSADELATTLRVLRAITSPTDSHPTPEGTP